MYYIFCKTGKKKLEKPHSRTYGRCANFRVNGGAINDRPDAIPEIMRAYIFYLFINNGADKASTK